VDGMTVVGVGIPTGTYVVSGAGTTSIVLSQATTAALSPTAVTFIPQMLPPRFLRLYYVCSATMTAGQVQSMIVLDGTQTNFYRPGITVPN